MTTSPTLEYQLLKSTDIICPVHHCIPSMGNSSKHSVDAQQMDGEWKEGMEGGRQRGME